MLQTSPPPGSDNAPAFSPAPADRARLRRLRLRAFGATVLVAGLLAAGLILRREGLADAAAQAVDALRAAGPLAFFAGMALLPAVGFPLLPFTLAAGPVFGPELGVGNVVACAIAAVGVNVALSYVLAARVLRPAILWVLQRLGYRLPALPADSDWQVVWIVRLAPGLPFWTQSYLLGLARVRFVPYIVVSTLLPAGYIGGTIVFGDALFRGHVRLALVAAAAVGLIAAGLQFWRRRQRSRRGGENAAGPG